MHLTADERRQVWSEVIARANGHVITAKCVKTVAADLFPDEDDGETTDEMTCKPITETPKKVVRAMIITDILTENTAVAREKLEEVQAHSAHTWADDCHLLILTRCSDTRPLLGLLEEYSCEIGTPLIIEQPNLRWPNDWSFARGEIQILHARRGQAEVKEELSNVVVCEQNLREADELPFALAAPRALHVQTWRSDRCCWRPQFSGACRAAGRLHGGVNSRRKRKSRGGLKRMKLK